MKFYVALVIGFAILPIASAQNPRPDADQLEKLVA
jgi:hypothetical protein